MTKYNGKYMLFFAGTYPKPKKNEADPVDRDLPVGYWVGLATAEIFGALTPNSHRFLKVGT